MEHKPLGWRIGPADDRDRPLKVALGRKMAEPGAKERGSRQWYSALTLDQWTGSCVGHGSIQLHNSSPKPHRLTDNDAMTVYDLAQRKYDPWPETPPEEGTSVRAGAMAMRELGYWSAFGMAYNYAGKEISVEEMALFILNHSPATMGIRWITGYDHPDRANGYFLKYEGRERGGHCIEVDAVSYYSDKPDKSWFRVHQSWGDGYGYKAYGHGGFARISWKVMQQIMDEEDSTVCSPLEAEGGAQ